MYGRKFLKKSRGPVLVPNRLKFLASLGTEIPCLRKKNHQCKWYKMTMKVMWKSQFLKIRSCWTIQFWVFIFIPTLEANARYRPRKFWGPICPHVGVIRWGRKISKNLWRPRNSSTTLQIFCNNRGQRPLATKKNSPVQFNQKWPWRSCHFANFKHSWVLNHSILWLHLHTSLRG
jgi:hypothetical protein